MSTEGGRQIEARNNIEERRYEVFVDEQLAGHTVYELRDERYWFVHTEIDPVFDGRGAGSFLVRAALDDMRDKGATIVPLCPFVAGWINRHREYEDLVDRKTLRRHKLANKVDLGAR